MSQLNKLPELQLSKALINVLQTFGSSKIFEEGQIILGDNSYIRSIPIVVRGSIKVFNTDEDGHEILLYYIKPGESCIMSFLGGLHQEKSKVSAIADEKTEVLFIPVEKVHLLIKENPEWLDYIFRLYHKRFEELLEMVNAVAFKRMDERLMSLLNVKAANLNSKSIIITHEQLANELGTSRVVVSRLLKQMEEEKLLKLFRNRIALS